MTFYNENDPKTAAWLRELIRVGLIAPGAVDERSIEDLTTKDLDGYDQHHFFAGIAGWSAAFRLAGVPDGFPVWSGSCPCQPFSVAGKGLGNADKRHLWPVWFKLIAICRPAIVIGEQVASAAGREWFDGVRADLEGVGYEVGAADLCAASEGAPHIRQRLFWVGHAKSGGQRIDWSAWRQSGHIDLAGEISGMGQSIQPRLERHTGDGYNWSEPGRNGAAAIGSTAKTGSTGFWSNYDFIYCRDNKVRRIESGTFPLAYGVSNRVVKLRGYGNAIVPELAATFIQEAFTAIAEIELKTV